MKKLMLFVLAVVMIASVAISASAVDYGTVEINKVTTAPTVDGKVDPNEYPTVFKFDASKSYWNYGSSEAAADYDVVLYMGWDETYLYTAATAKATTARTYTGDMPSSTRPYIFDRRHVMSAIVAGNPAETRYQPADGKAWPWGDAANSGYGNEWTITANPDGENGKADHFGSVSTNANFSYKVTISENGTEVYEQAIPWAAITGGKVDAKKGTIFGYAVTIACTEADLKEEKDPNCVYATFGAGITSYKNFAEYVALTLAGEKPVEEEPETSEPAEDNPKTGDAFGLFAVVALISLAGATVVAKKRG